MPLVLGYNHSNVNGAFGFRRGPQELLSGRVRRRVRGHSAATSVRPLFRPAHGGGERRGDHEGQLPVEDVRAGFPERVRRQRQGKRAFTFSILSFANVATFGSFGLIERELF